MIQVCTDPDKLMGLAMAVVNMPKSESPADDVRGELAATANLIAAMRNEMPPLLDELVSARAERDRAIAEVESWRSWAADVRGWIGAEPYTAISVTHVEALLARLDALLPTTPEEAKR